jgi:hypothetical protein
VGQAPLAVEPSRFAEILERLKPVAQELVLVGGQAVHVWAGRYRDRVPELDREWPYTTKDLDFCGTAAQARECARILGGSLREFHVADRTSCIAVVKVGDLQIDFLRAPYGLPDVEQLRARSVPYEYGRVMHPMHMLESRTANVADLPTHQTERHLKQLRGAILCVRQMLLETLDQSATDPRAVRGALQISERVFSLAGSYVGLRAQVERGLDVLDAIVVDPRLPQAFREHRYPQAKAQVDAKRLQLRRSIEKASAHAQLDEPAVQEGSQAPERKNRGRHR